MHSSRWTSVVAGCVVGMVAVATALTFGVTEDATIAALPAESNTAPPGLRSPSPTSTPTDTFEPSPAPAASPVETVAAPAPVAAPSAPVVMPSPTMVPVANPVTAPAPAPAPTTAAPPPPTPMPSPTPRPRRCLLILCAP